MRCEGAAVSSTGHDGSKAGGDRSSAAVQLGPRGRGEAGEEGESKRALTGNTQGWSVSSWARWRRRICDRRCRGTMWSSMASLQGTLAHDLRRGDFPVDGGARRNGIVASHRQWPGERRMVSMAALCWCTGKKLEERERVPG